MPGAAKYSLTGTNANLDTRRENPQYCFMLLVAQACRYMQALGVCAGRVTDGAPHRCGFAPSALQKSPKECTIMPEKAPSDQAPLRTEIVESQKARVDLLKYKLLAVAALGAFGLSRDNTSPMCIYSFCFIPFVCIYIDLLCFHNTLRILVIAKYLKNSCRDPYELFITNHLEEYHHNKVGFFFKLEDWALQWSSIALSIILAFFGLWLGFQKSCHPEACFFLLAGVAGFILVIISLIVYGKRLTALSDCTDRCNLDPTARPS
jgi:hypothetical protein